MSAIRSLSGDLPSVLRARWERADERVRHYESLLSDWRAHRWEVGVKLSQWERERLPVLAPPIKLEFVEE